jgi:MFS superfamily sulfate permease-like transporter
VYYGSLPVIEAAYQRVIQEDGRVTLDFSTCHYIDREGLRWLSELKRKPNVTLIDRRRASERRHQERRGGEDPDRAAGRRRSRADRRRRDEV